MITLNRDYSGIEKQIAYIEKNFSKYANPLEVYDYMELYIALIRSIDIGANPGFLKIFSSNQLSTFQRQRLLNSKALRKSLENNTLFHQYFFEYSYLAVSELIDDIKENDSLSFLKRYPHFREKSSKPKKLLEAFFKEEDLELYDVFRDMCRHKKIYYNDKDREFYCLYNNLQDIPNIFFPIRILGIEELGNLVHELGHVKDNMEVRQQFYRYDLTYCYRSFYREVLSYYYQHSFFNFLSDDTKYKEETKKEVFFDMLSLQKALKRGKEWLATGEYVDDALFYEAQYIYGPIIASTLGPVINYRQLQSFQYDYFSQEQLEQVGITIPNAVDCYVKQMKNIMKR